MLSGDGVRAIEDLWRGRIVNLSQRGDDFQVSVEPKLSK